MKNQNDLRELYARCREGLKRCLLWSDEDIAELESVLALDLKPGPGAPRYDNNPMPDLDVRREHWRRWFEEMIAEWDGPTTARIRASIALDKENGKRATISFMDAQTETERNVAREKVERTQRERSAQMGLMV